MPERQKLIVRKAKAKNEWETKVNSFAFWCRRESKQICLGPLLGKGSNRPRGSIVWKSMLLVCNSFFDQVQSVFHSQLWIT